MNKCPSLSMGSEMRGVYLQTPPMLTGGVLNVVDESSSNLNAIRDQIDRLIWNAPAVVTLPLFTVGSALVKKIIDP